MQQRRSVGTQARHVDAAQARVMGTAVQSFAAALDREPDVLAEEHEAFMARLHRIGRTAAAVRTAWVLRDQYSIRPVPLDPAKLEPCADPLEDNDAILKHYEANPSHAVGITTGKHPERPWSYLAVQVDTFAAWNDWLHDAAAYTQQAPDTQGWAAFPGITIRGDLPEQTHYRDPGPYARLLWSPPPMPRFSGSRMDAEGGDLKRRWDRQRTGRGGWLWFVINDPDGIRTVRKDRKLAPGVRLLASGTVVPWEGTRTPEGWTLALESPVNSGGLKPSSAPEAPWLIDKLTETRNR